MDEQKLLRAYANTEDGQIHYCSAGNGDAILLLHQTPSSVREYKDVMPILARQYQAIAMDTIGFGFSDKATREYSVPDYALSVKRFLECIGVDKAHVVGHHTGASIALEFAATWPHMVGKLVLDGLAYFRNAEERLALLKDPRFQPWEVQADGSHLDPVKARFARGRYPPEVSKETINTIAIDVLLAGGEGEYAHKACFLYDPIPALSRITNPTLLTSGTKDIFYGRHEEVKGLMVNCKCKTHTFPGGVGVLPQQLPKELATAILDFIGDPNY